MFLRTTSPFFKSETSFKSKLYSNITSLFKLNSEASSLNGYTSFDMEPNAKSEK